jgi:hypothetical protein
MNEIKTPRQDSASHLFPVSAVYGKFFGPTSDFCSPKMKRQN